MTSEQNRRKFLGAAAGAAAFTIVPRHVLGGPGYVPPSDKITLAHIGVGTEGLREMMPMLGAPELQIVSVCDPNKDAAGYRDWSSDGLLRQIRATLDKSGWWVGADGTIPGGRDAAQDIVNTFYGSQSGTNAYKGCSAYADYRELFEKERDIDAVKIMTPDHLHGVIAMAAMKHGKHVIVHKPIANRLQEARAVIDAARAGKVATHFMPWDANGSMDPVMGWIREGAIGTLREVHNWTNRPVWPQYATMPAENVPVPKGFDWDLWLGPEAARPYHPSYTHMVFRGWYDFGGGSMADMGHYSLWTVFNALELEGPISVEPMLSHNCAFAENVSTTVYNTFSFPTASVVRFRYPARGARPPVDLIWYEGGMRPATPDELDEDHRELPAEGMMFVGDKGKILAGFHVDSPRLIPERKMQGRTAPEPPRRQPLERGISASLQQWAAACRGGAPSPGNFGNAWPISEAVNLYAVALRTGKKLLYDAENRKITNVSEANRYLSREYRKGFEI
ncbi:MAG TPA: Gfo/Idh/MocA family oxidoreductase [Bryobacteraceae bacterium]|nr:Gfo/Idh/MocA family oxidoreductase [Bryobacteraceae bacterium]